VGKIYVQIDMEGTLAAAEHLYYDTDRWATFVDGFHHVVSVKGDWPREGGRVTWDSTPNGRGRVVESVVAYEPGVGQTSEVEDPEARGTQSVAFQTLQDGVSVRLELDYELKRSQPIAFLLDSLFIRRAQRDALRRTLDRFANELAADLALLR
jgi:hypothetical protein